MTKMSESDILRDVTLIAGIDEKKWDVRNTYNSWPPENY